MDRELGIEALQRLVINFSPHLPCARAPSPRWSLLYLLSFRSFAACAFLPPSLSRCLSIVCLTDRG